MGISTKKQVWRLQELLYERAHSDAIHLACGASKTILKYAEDFEASLPESFQVVKKSKLYQEINNSDIILYGDFHTLRQSQKGLLRIMRDLVSNHKQIVLGLETFRATDQDHLDKYMNGELNEPEFLEKVLYDQNWGFPWSNYKLLLDFAQQNKIKVLGINSENAGSDTIQHRDEIAASVLIKEATDNPKAVLIALIGEYHLADTKLPQEIEKVGTRQKVLKIVTNIDHYFFELQKEGLTSSTQYLKLKDDLFCIMNSPPWIKWQSYTIWEESKEIFDEGSDNFNLSTIDSIAEYNESGYDIDYHFFSLCKDLLNFLGIELSDSEVGKFYIVENAGHPAVINNQIQSLRSKVEVIRSAIDGTYFDSESQTVYATSVSLNGMAESAGQFVYHLTSGFNERNGDEVEQFYRRVLKFAIGMLTSRVFNPRRKCSNIASAKSFVKSTKNKKMNSLGTHKRTVAQGVIKHHEWMLRNMVYESIRYPLRTVYKDDIATSYSISRYIGLVLGFDLYTYIVMNGAAHSIMKKLFLSEVPDKKMVWETVRYMYEITFLRQLDPKGSKMKKIS